MAGWSDDVQIRIREIENGFLLNEQVFFRTKKDLAKYVNKLILEAE